MKNYEPQKFTVEKDSLELNRNCSSFFIPITCTDFNFVKKPRLFVRGDGNALLRINIYHYNPVKIPREYIRQIRKEQAVELLLHNNNDSVVESRPAPVSPVLCFPECCELYQNNETGEKEEPGNLSELFEDFIPDIQDTAAAALDKWLAEHPEFSMTRINFEFENAIFPFCFVTDYKSQAFLVCLFDQSEEWQAEEDSFDGDIPKYYSPDKVCISPFFALTAVADYLWCRTGSVFPKLVLLGEKTVISNIREMNETWKSMHASICSCRQERESSVIMPFTTYANKLLNIKSFNSQTELSELTRHFKDLQEHSLEKLCQNLMRMYFLRQHFLEKECYSSEAAIVETWLEGGRSGNILLGRFFYAGYFFNLIYNFRNVAVVLENTPDTGEPVKAILEICKKLHASGTLAHLTPCIVSQKHVSNTTTEYVKIYNGDQLFRLEKFAFSRETGFDRLPPVSKDDVRALLAFASDIFGKKQAAEECSKTIDSFFSHELQRLEKNWSDKNILFLHDTQRFANPVLALYMHNRNSTSVIIIKCFTGSNLSEIKNLLAEEHTHNASLFETNRLKTVILANNIQENRANYIEINNVFYTRFNDFMPLICQLLMTF